MVVIEKILGILMFSLFVKGILHIYLDKQINHDFFKIIPTDKYIFYRVNLKPENTFQDILIKTANFLRLTGFVGCFLFILYLILKLIL